MQQIVVHETANETISRIQFSIYLFFFLQTMQCNSRVSGFVDVKSCFSFLLVLQSSVHLARRPVEKKIALNRRRNRSGLATFDEILTYSCEHP